MNIIEELIKLHTKAATKIPIDVLEAVSKFTQRETHELSKFTLQAICENYDIAAKESRAMCADTGLPRYYVKIGDNVKIPEGMIELIRQMKLAVAKATKQIPLRSNYVDPLSRHDNGDNTGLFAPDITYSYEPNADWIDITTVHKGGLFGSDYRMLFPTDGIEGIKKVFSRNNFSLFSSWIILPTCNYRSWSWGNKGSLFFSW